MSDQIQQTKPNKEINALPVIGIFLLVFGVAVIIAIFFTETYQGKIINLISGLLLILCASVALFWSRKRTR